MKISRQKGCGGFIVTPGFAFFFLTLRSLSKQCGAGRSPYFCSGVTETRLRRTYTHTHATHTLTTLLAQDQTHSRRLCARVHFYFSKRHSSGGEHVVTQCGSIARARNHTCGAGTRVCLQRPTTRNYANGRLFFCLAPLPNAGQTKHRPRGRNDYVAFVYITARAGRIERSSPQPVVDRNSGSCARRRFRDNVSKISRNFLMHYVERANICFVLFTPADSARTLHPEYRVGGVK